MTNSQVQAWINLALESIIIVGGALWLSFRFWLRRKNSQLNVEGKAYDVFLQSYEENKRRLAELETGLKNSFAALDQMKLELATFKEREQSQRFLIAQQESRLESITHQNEALRLAIEEKDRQLSAVGKELADRHTELMLLQIEHGRTKAQLDLLLNLANSLKINLIIQKEETKHETQNPIPSDQPVSNPA